MTRTFTPSKSPPGEPAPDRALTPRSVPEVDPTGLGARMKALIGQESVSSFARRCGLGESVLRSYLADHRMPALDKALAIAIAAGVTLDWLATGRSSRTTAQFPAACTTSSGDANRADPLSLPQLDAAILKGILKAVLAAQSPRASPAHLAALAIDLYRRATATDPPR